MTSLAFNRPPEPGSQPSTNERAAASLMGGRVAHAELVARYQWIAPLAHGQEVLVAGSGAGYGTRMLAAAGAARVVGVDSSPTAVAHAAGHAPHLEHLTADLHELPFAEGSFDLAVCFAANANLDATIAELYRVLRPAGVAAICSTAYAAADLHAAICGSFAVCRFQRQRSWAATTIGDPDDGPLRASTSDGEAGGASTAILALASDGAIPTLPPSALLTDSYDARLWQHRLDELHAELQATHRQLERLRASEAHSAALATNATAAVEALSTENAELLETRRQLHLVNEELVTAKVFATRIEVMEASTSWRLTRPLRTCRGLLRRAR